MGRIAPQELAAERELRADLRFDRARVLAVDPLVERDPCARAYAAAAEASGHRTIKLALVTMPRSCASMMPRLIPAL